VNPCEKENLFVSELKILMEYGLMLKKLIVGVVCIVFV